MSSAISNEKKVGLILLAAGASERLGRPKQLLTYRGQTLLQHSLNTAIASQAQPVAVILGANSEVLKNEIKDFNAHVVMNVEWMEGMASSIRCGIQAVTEINIAVEGILLMVCDQPFVTSDLLNELIMTHKNTGKQIVACAYEASFGPPVFFHQSLFEELLQLKGDTGARSILGQHTDMVEIIPFPQGTFDVDTEADYERLKSTALNDQRQL
jgi:molybdenum cofactor cytidylyltransferase